MTDEEILMELHPAFSEETAWMQNNKFPRTYDKEILAYRAGYEKGYDKAIDDAAWNYGYYDMDEIE